ncbi:hypothetical protein [Methanothrix soehngenii]|uniref:hypothetical protein n=1 Tax=Methanothrix soehngenii TaxID=2223 RepID=UPI00300CA6E4
MDEKMPNPIPINLVSKGLDRLDLSRSYRAGDVQLLWSIAEDLGFIQIIDGICCSDSGLNGVSPGKLLTVWAINRAIRTG